MDDTVKMVGIKAVFLDIDGVLTDGTVLIDSTGGALGLLALWAYGRWRKKW